MSNPNRFTDEVLPAVFDRLDSVFPEFGWQRRKRGWVATNETFSHERFSVRADRIICKEHQGYYIHGKSESEHWLSYLNDGHFPRGEEWHRVASELARRVGMLPFAGVQAPGAPWRRVLEAAQSQLTSDGGARGRAYCERRKLLWDEWGLGFIVDLEAAVKAAGLGVAEARRLRVMTSRPGEDWWTGRLLGGIYDAGGNVVGLWGRAISDCAEKYLVSGSSQPSVLGRVRAKRVVVTEGWLDGLRVRSTSGDAVVVAGGTQLTDEVLDAVRDASEVVIGFDGDVAGDAGRRSAARRLISWRGPPTSFIGGLGPDEDLDEVLADRGVRGWASLLAGATSWLQYAAERELDGKRGSEEVAALRRVGALCKAALPLWPVEVGTTLRAVAQRHRLDERFLLKVLEGASTEAV